MICITCEGTGVIVTSKTIAKCCGNFSVHGECRADCAIPHEEDDYEMCQACNGVGNVST